MFAKSIRLFGVVTLSMLGVAKTGYSQGDNAGSSSSNSYAKVTLTSIPGVREDAPSDRISRKAAADSAWEAMPQWSIDTSLTRMQQFVKDEIFYLDYLEHGYRFWQMFPEDKRKYEWLKMTTFYVPKFWIDKKHGAAEIAKSIFHNSPVDTIIKNRWVNILDNCGNVFLNDPEVSSIDKNAYRVGLVGVPLSNTFNASYYGSEESFVSELKHRIDNAVNFVEDNELSGQLIMTMNRLLGGTTKLGISMGGLKEFVNSYINSEHQGIRKWALQKSALLNSELKTFKFFDSSIIKGMNAEKFKNKVVLIDFWNIYCPSCIARMPVIKSVFEKYHDFGFEVISACLDSESQKDRIEKIIKKIDAGWIDMTIGGESEKDSFSAPWRDIWKAYGFFGVPQLILFDKKGQLVTVNGPLIYDKSLDGLIRMLVNE